MAPRSLQVTLGDQFGGPNAVQVALGDQFGGLSGVQVALGKWQVALGGRLAGRFGGPKFFQPGRIRKT